jgi:DNA ligase-1
MREFAALYASLDATNKTNEKVTLLASYMAAAADTDRVWAIALLSHRRPRRLITSTVLKAWAAKQAGIPGWLFEETYHTVGDLAETIALLVTGQESTWPHSLSETIHLLAQWSLESEEQQLEKIANAWNGMTTTERLVFNKLLTGGFRMGISQKLMTRALHMSLSIDEEELAHRLMGEWDPFTIAFYDLVSAQDNTAVLSRPFPFCLAHSLETEVKTSTFASDWIAEWKWDGIRAQIIRREGKLFIWSRGEELITAQYPEFDALAEVEQQDFVLDGELVAINEKGQPSFSALQKRMNRKSISKKLRASILVRFIAYDLLESDGIDLRSLPFLKRRQQLEEVVKALVKHAPLQISEAWTSKNWEELESKRFLARELKAEGLMLKHRNSAYSSGRKKGVWWKWKHDPMTIDAVLLYAQSGHGRRANLFTDYTFAVWDGDQLIPFTKAYSGLTDKEFEEISRFVRQHSRERFGPVRSVEPILVFEIGFEGIQASNRHKSGIALRFPRMLRWRRDKPASEAGTIEELKRFLNEGG